MSAQHVPDRSLRDELRLRPGDADIGEGAIVQLPELPTRPGVLHGGAGCAPEMNQPVLDRRAGLAGGKLDDGLRHDRLL